MKIQFLNGGLANQAFQYIFTRVYELSHPGEVIYMDDSYFALNTVHNGYELE
ncbi:MAG: alpha-1,2-fucosyltransferase, partial [Lachnospiraceae bacterium]|nr:alpha-1,2-fucosyltransferase [Lachnospiraceae bacterium]